MVTKRLRLESPEEALELLGEQDAALRQMESDFGVEMFLHQDMQTNDLRLSIKGASARVEKAMRRIRDRLTLLRQRRAGAQGGERPAGINLNAPSLPEDGIYRSAFGRISRRTPLRSSAVIRPRSTSSLRMNERWKSPI